MAKKKGGRSRGESKTSPRRVSSKQRAAEAIELRKAGATYQQIADQLGYRSPQAAHKAVTSTLNKLVKEPAEELIRLEMERLDRLWLEMYAQAQRGIFGAIDRCLKIMERRARLLGLDMPAQFVVRGDVKLKGYVNVSPEDWDEEPTES